MGTQLKPYRDGFTAWRPGCLVADSDYVIRPEELDWESSVSPKAKDCAKVVRIVDEAIGWMMRKSV